MLARMDVYVKIAPVKLKSAAREEIAANQVIVTDAPKNAGMDASVMIVDVE